MKAVIVIGENTVVDGKILPRLWGLTLLERSLYTLRDAGINGFLIVCGSQYDAVNKHIENKKLKRDFNLTLFNSIEQIQMTDNQILFVDSNLLFDKNIIKNLISKRNTKPLVCVDSSPKYVEMDTDLSEGFANVGIFLCNKRELPILENIAQNTFIPKEVTKNSGMEFNDLNGAFWYKIETKQNLETARAILLDRYSSNPGYFEDTITISVRKLFSKSLLKWLVNTRLSPNQISVIGLSSFLASAFLFSFGDYFFNVVGGLLLMVGISLDFMDGMVARLTLKTSKLGEWLEHIFDCIAMNFVIFGATIGLYIQTGYMWSWMLGMFLIILHSVNSFLNKTYLEIFKEDINSAEFHARRLNSGSVSKFFYKFFRLCSRSFLWMLAGAFLNIMLISFMIIALGTSYQVTMSLVLGLKQGGKTADGKTN